MATLTSPGVVFDSHPHEFPTMSFSSNIQKFNGIYKLPVEIVPTLTAVGSAAERLKAFKNILAEELTEIDEIIDAAVIHEDTLYHDPVTEFERKVSILTSLADLLGDIQVYCASEMAKFGLPQDQILEIIMQSNFSKLGADGLPIYDERGKVQKGPNYYKPEPEIEVLLSELIIEHVEALV